MASGVHAFDDNAESFGNSRLLATSFPKVRYGLFEGEADASFVVGVGVEIYDADFLLLLAAFVDKKNGVAKGDFGFQGDEGAAGIDEDRLGVFVESTAFVGKTVNHDGYALGDALAGAGSFLCTGGREGDCKRCGCFWRGLRIVEGGDFHCLLGNALLRAVFAALEIPSLLEDLFEGFLTVGKSDPGVAVPVRATEPDGEVPRHVSSLRNLMIPAQRVEGREPVGGCTSKSKRVWADGDWCDFLGGAVTLGKLRSEEHTSELQSQFHLVCRLMLEKK